MEMVYIGVFKAGELLATMCWPSPEEVSVEFIDGLHDMGCVIKPFTKEEYEAEGWDELTPADIKAGNYYWETNANN